MCSLLFRTFVNLPVLSYLIIFFNPLYSGKPKTITFTNSENPDQMTHHPQDYTVCLGKNYLETKLQYLKSLDTCMYNGLFPGLSQV